MERTTTDMDDRRRSFSRDFTDWNSVIDSRSCGEVCEGHDIERTCNSDKLRLALWRCPRSRTRYTIGYRAFINFPSAQPIYYLVTSIFSYRVSIEQRETENCFGNIYVWDFKENKINGLRKFEKVVSAGTAAYSRGRNFGGDPRSVDWTDRRARITTRKWKTKLLISSVGGRNIGRVAGNFGEKP